MTKVSVIIPCYNHGKYLDDAVNSVLPQTLREVEIIIVNDGSTDPLTNALLANYRQPNTTVIQLPHGGPSIARNTAIQQAQGEYILPLDADDKIEATYLEKAVKILEANERIGIVYCKAGYFGKRSGVWESPVFDLKQMLKENLIFSAAMFRKADWQAVNGYNIHLLHGKEDYDLWLSIIQLQREVYCIPERLFYYRKHFFKRRSHSKRATQQQEIETQQRIFQNHLPLYTQHIDVLFEMVQDLRLRMFRLKERSLRRRIKRLFSRA